ncbi:MAG: RecX family transcriptional regulator [Acholeplasmatales bacterium]|nr:RecX family transcriptional regulator [Acholeplasmatales bacterium]
MIVKSLKRIGKTNKYSVIIDDITYKFNENIIVNYRLVKGKEVTKDILFKAIKENDYDTLYLKAERYVITYNKSEKEIRRYLKNKDANPNDIENIILKLRKNKLIDDSSLIIDLINSLIKKYNGIKMIESKLYQKGFDEALIKKSLFEIDYDLYCNCLNILYNKIRNKYDKYDDYTRINKIKSYLLQRGYTYSDIADLKIK